VNTPEECAAIIGTTYVAFSIPYLVIERMVSYPRREVFSFVDFLQIELMLR
jgi:hypothetical protein